MTIDIERLNKMRQDFVANVSHELRTPLTVVHGYVETLLSLPNIDSTLHKIFTSMQEQTIRMQHLIEDLLLLSKIESESPEAAYEPIHLKKMIESLKNDMAQLGKEHVITWEINPTLDLLGEPHELRSAFLNLLTNAVRYTPIGGKITIRTGVEKNGHAFFSVQDSGVGIEAKHLSRLTERFYRVDKGRSRDLGGTGLGLAIVKHVLLRHQAELMITSELEKGSEFTCLFPQERGTKPELP